MGFSLAVRSRMRLRLALLVPVLLCSPLVSAQVPKPTAWAPIVEAGLGYSYLSLEVPSSSRLNLNGVDANLTVDFSSHLGARADFAYDFAPNAYGSGNKAQVLSYLGGPLLYLWNHKRTSVYMHSLFGGARVSGAVPASNYGYWLGYINKFSFDVGGGVQYRDTKSLSYRLGADYLHSSFIDPNAAVRGQNNLRVTASVVYIFGRGPGR